MNPFGSREDDPLLQNDPLAPSDDEPTDDTSTDGAPSDQRSSPNDEAAVPPPEDAPPPDVGSEDSHSVFERSSPENGDPDAPIRFHNNNDAPVIHRSAAEGSIGQLSALNSALDEGWRLDRVELREERLTTADVEDAPSRSEQPPLTLAFVLREPE